MTVPTFDRFIEPTLRFLASHPDGASTRDVYAEVAKAVGLSGDALQETVPSGGQPKYKNRIGWAHDRLKRAGFSCSLRRGFWQLTPLGLEFHRTNPVLLDEQIQELATGNNDTRLRPFVEGADGAVAKLAKGDSEEVAGVLSPDERLEQALDEIRQRVREEILESLKRVSPSFFEILVLDLLHRMGYGMNREDLSRVGRSGDGGIDGIIPLDKLGLEKVYIQAKRWQQAVGRPEIQAFYGALAGQKARKGVFVTTSDFTAQARDFTATVQGIVLVDGRRLASLMMEHEVGVTLRPLLIPKIDIDYFDGELE